MIKELAAKGIIFLILIQYLLVSLVGSYFLYLDEILIILLLPFFLNEILTKKSILLFCIAYIVTKALILFFWDQRFYPMIYDLIDILKPLFLFWSAYFLIGKLSNKSLAKIERYYRVFFVATLVYGLLQFLFFYLAKISLPLLSSKYFQGAEYLIGDRFGLIRANSIFGHPLWFGYICAFSGVFYLMNQKFWICLLSLVGIVVTFSRWALFIYILGIFIYVVQNRSERGFVTTAIYFLIPVSSIFILLNIDQIIGYYNQFWEGYNESAIKVYGIKKGIELLLENPFGYGIGTYGTDVSIGSGVYKLIEFNTNALLRLDYSSSGIESFITILAVQIGLDGLFVYFLPFLVKLRGSRDDFLFLLIFIIFSLISTYNSYLLVLVPLFINCVKNGITQNPFYKL